MRAAGALADPQPLSCQVAAVSVGVVGGRVRLDLPYEEDSRAEVDMNVVGTDAGRSSRCKAPRRAPHSRAATLDAMLDVALAGIDTLTRHQREVLAAPYPKELPAPKERR